MERPWHRHRLSELFAVHPAVAILGLRQCGKTTLARGYAQGYDAEPVTLFDLEDPTDAA
jgi:predicted AAA+ superfamily ATPase